MLEERDLRSFYEDGYLHLPGVVPLELCLAARQAINHSVWSVGKGAPDPECHRRSEWCRELSNDPVITDIFDTTGVRERLEALLGEGNLESIGGVQVKIRFPGPVGEEPGGLEGHIDGIGSGVNGNPNGFYERSFTVLAVVYLGDVTERFHGNFTVWPGSHRRLEEHFRNYGHQDLAKGTPSVAQEGPAHQIVGRTGDLVLCHHMTAHAPAPHVGPDIRYALIARPRHVDCFRNGLSAFTDMWREWPGVVAP